MRRSIRATSAPAWAAVLVLLVGGIGGTPVVAAPSGTATVADDVPVTAVDLSRVSANNSAAIAVDPTEPRFLALASRLDAPQFHCVLSVSGDGGRSWLEVAPVRKLPKGVERCYAPEVGFDADGKLYFLFAGLHGLGNKPVGVFLTTSTDRGRSFGEPRRVLGAEKFGVRMAIDPTMGEHGRIHLVWIAVGAPTTTGGFPAVPNPIVAAYSDDGGKTFSPPTPVSDPDRTRVVAPALAVGPDHAVHVVYYDLLDDARDYQGLEGPTWEGTWSLVMASSADGGRFSPGVVVEEAVVPPERAMLIFTMPPPSVAAGADARVFAAWHDARNGDWDVFLRRSLDGGATWEDAVRLNDDQVGNRRHQYQPRLDVAPSGRLDAVFYDRRDDPENLRNNVSYTFSTDGGTLFSENRRLAELPSDSQKGPAYPLPSAAGLIEFGSRIGLLSTDDAAVAAWTDTRNSIDDQQDLFANEVRFGPRPAAPVREERGSGPAVALGIGLALLAVAAVIAVRLRRAGAAARPDAAG